MLRKFLVALVAVALLLVAVGCGSDAEPKAPVATRTLCLYSELDSKFTQDLVESFNKNNKEGIQLRFIGEMKPEAPLPELVLAEQRTLYGFKQQGKLQPTSFALAEKLPAKLKDKEGHWFGVFYDPAVLLVNQYFARTIGQSAMKGWTDLENNEQLRVAMENLSDSNSTQNFLGAFADAMGETTSLNYLWNINRFVGQYAKFPFTSIRMTAVGDADVAITRQSYVFKYLENKFPAYVVHPREGTPVNLYCVGMFSGCNEEQEKAVVQFMSWLISSDKVQAVAQTNNTGYMFIFPRGVDAKPVDAKKLWLNTSYLEPAKQEALTNRWLERVRFSK